MAGRNGLKINRETAESASIGLRTFPTNKAVRRGWNPAPDLAATSRKGDALASVQGTAPDPTSVYRYYDRTGLLIYVGITRQGMGRNRQHNAKADWWPYVATQEVEHYPNRPEAARREKALIHRYRPPFNKQHNLEHEELRAAYVNYASSVPQRVTPLDLYKRLGKKLPLDFISQEGNELVLRSRREHSSLALTLRPKGGGVPICVNRGIGMVVDIRLDSVHAYLISKTKGSIGRDVISGVAHLAFKMDTKPPHARLDKVSITLAGA